MTTPILTLAEVEALAGFTEGPWTLSKTRINDIFDSNVPDARAVAEFVQRHNRPLIVAAPGLHATCLHLFGEVARLTAELEKPVVTLWERGAGGWVRWSEYAIVAEVDTKGFTGWTVHRDGVVVARGPETGDAGKRAADLALVAAGYRLVGGVFGEVSDV